MELTNSELTVDEINREFPYVEIFSSNEMYYAKLSGVVIAADPDARELHEQIRDYSARVREAGQ